MPSLGFAEQELHATGAYWTAREIAQQPDMLLATHALIAARRPQIREFVDAFLQDPLARIILTGAGTSAFIGECLAPFLDAALPARVEAIATTDIVSSPTLYLQANHPTLMVSFGRSGNSPESLAAIEAADAVIGNVRHLMITCNAEGQLARPLNANRLPILLPDAAHDRSFAMTSSFTSMMYAAWASLCQSLDDPAAIAASCRSLIETCVPAMHQLADAQFERVVYLGSGPLKGLAREAALKLTELTDGRILTSFDSPLGFRHGPKTVVNDRTLIVIFLSNNPLTRAYDRDLHDELVNDATAARIVTLSAIDDVPGAIVVPGMDDAPDHELLYPFIIVPQIYAVMASLQAGLHPDSPNVAGTVNRVVQGVRIHSALAAG